MNKTLDELKTYLDSVSEQELKKDWEELKKYNKSGFYMMDVLDENYKRKKRYKYFINKIKKIIFCKKLN